MSGDRTAGPGPAGVAPPQAAPAGSAAAGGGRRVLLAGTAFLVCVALVVMLIGWDGGRRTPSAGGQLGQAAAGNPEHMPSMPAGRPAPVFQLPSLSGGLPVYSGAFAGSPLVVNFFASWCRNCADEMRTFASEADAVQGRVAFVGVDLNDPDQRTAKAIIARAGVRYPVGVDRSAGTAVAYWVVALPTTVFIDRHGRLLGEAFGAQSSRQLQAWIDRLESS